MHGDVTLRPAPLQAYGDWLNRGLHASGAEDALRRAGVQPVDVEQVLDRLALLKAALADLVLLVMEHRPPATVYLVTGAMCDSRLGQVDLR